MRHTLTVDEARVLGALATHDGAGRHFTALVTDDQIARWERLGLIEVDRPVHAGTGLPYSRDSWTVVVAEEVAKWFDQYGELRGGLFPLERDGIQTA